MAENETPKESENTIYQRDKTAKEPVLASDAPKKPVKPKIKPKKIFVPKKTSFKTDKPMEYRTRHLLVSSLAAVQVIRETLVEFKNELAEQPTDDPDKEFHDREKLERLFSRLAKKYSVCPTKAVGGELGWIYKGLKITDEIMTQNLVETILATEKYTLPEPIRTRLGYHLILICENQILEPKETEEPNQGPTPPPAGTNIPG